MNNLLGGYSSWRCSVEVVTDILAHHSHTPTLAPQNNTNEDLKNKQSNGNEQNVDSQQPTKQLYDDSQTLSRVAKSVQMLIIGRLTFIRQTDFRRWRHFRQRPWQPISVTSRPPAATDDNNLMSYRNILILQLSRNIVGLSWSVCTAESAIVCPRIRS